MYRAVFFPDASAKTHARYIEKKKEKKQYTVFALFNKDIFIQMNFQFTKFILYFITFIVKH